MFKYERIIGAYMSTVDFKMSERVFNEREFDLYLYDDTNNTRKLIIGYRYAQDIHNTGKLIEKLDINPLFVAKIRNMLDIPNKNSIIVTSAIIEWFNKKYNKNVGPYSYEFVLTWGY